MTKVGQIYKQPNNEIFVVTFIDKESNVHLVYKDGYTASYRADVFNPFSFDKLIAEYPTWQEAVNSKEFKE